MDKKDAQSRLMDYLYDEMGPAERREFEEILRNDPGLKQKLDDMQSTRNLLQEDNTEIKPGNLLLIKHADGWVTAYAHTQEILVSHGQQVKRGQLVARVGATGSVAQPQLHFEVRQGSKAKYPAKLLGSQQAAR